VIVNAAPAEADLQRYNNPSPKPVPEVVLLFYGRLISHPLEIN